MEDYLGKKTSFGGWIYYSRGEKMNIFSIDFNRKSEELSFNSKDNSLTFLCDKRRERFFQNLSLFDNWSCSTTQEIL